MPTLPPNSAAGSLSLLESYTFSDNVWQETGQMFYLYTLFQRPWVAFLTLDDAAG
jgi:hypothetical protein